MDRSSLYDVTKKAQQPKPNDQPSLYFEAESPAAE